MADPAEQGARDTAAVTDGQPGLEQFDEAETSEEDQITWEVFMSGWLTRDSAEVMAEYLARSAPAPLVIGVRQVGQ